MPPVLTADPIMSLARAAEFGYNDTDTATNLINIVSLKFKEFTNRININEKALVESVPAYDGNACFIHAPPIQESFVVVTEYYRDGSDSLSLQEEQKELIVDRERGSIVRVADKWLVCQGFANLQVVYTGGWMDVPASVEAGALAQMKIEQDRIKGSVGHDNYGLGGETLSPDRSGVITEAAEAWHRYRILV